MSQEERTAEYGAWNPGLQSELPREYLPLSTILRPENVSTSVAKAHELSDYCGLPVHELVAFRPERLIVHELLVRVTASLGVPDGSDYEDLGRNFRLIASTILNTYVAPHRADVAQAFERLKRDASAMIARELAKALSPVCAPKAVAAQGGRWRWPFTFAKADKQPPSTESVDARERRMIAEWSRKAQSADNRLEESCCQALSTIATAIASRRGRLLADKALLTELALTLVCNDYGSEVIGEAIVPYFQERGCAGRLPALGAARQAGGHERQGRVGVGKKLDATAAAHPGEEARLSAGRILR